MLCDLRTALATLCPEVVVQVFIREAPCDDRHSTTFFVVEKCTNNVGESVDRGFEVGAIIECMRHCVERRCDLHTLSAHFLDDSKLRCIVGASAQIRPKDVAFGVIIEFEFFA